MTVRPIPCSDLRYPTIAMCLSRPQSVMMLCHSAIERPYFASIDGKYDAGPCFGHGADCSVTLEPSRSHGSRQMVSGSILAPPPQHGRRSDDSVCNQVPVGR
jgi:hypothetical protein